MRSSFLLALLAFNCVISLTYGSEAVLHLLSRDSRARCLDGTSPGFYFTPGTGAGLLNYLIYFEGGGRCGGDDLKSTLLDCVDRSTTDLGSSSTWSQTYSNDGNFNEDENANPLYHNWTKVFVKYCDGALYQGSSEPITVQNTVLYFRGYDNVVGIFDVLRNDFGLFSAQTVVLGGGSAGGLGSFCWSQYFRNHLPNNILMISVPDSGYFPYIEGVGGADIEEYIDLLTNFQRNLLQPEGCPYLNDGINVEKCQFMQFLTDLIPSPVFITESLYDGYTLKNLIDVTCVTDSNSLSNCNADDLLKITLVHTETKKQLQIIQKNHPNWGIWAISCVEHVFSEDAYSFSGAGYSVPQKVRQTVAQTQKEYIEAYIRNEGKGLFKIDQALYPYNFPCNGFNSQA